MRRTLVSALLLIAGVATVTNTYRQQPFIARGSETLRSAPAVRKGGDGVRHPYMPRFYSDVSRGIKGCRWLMECAIETNNSNWLQRYRACAQWAFIMVSPSSAAGPDLAEEVAPASSGT